VKVEIPPESPFAGLAMKPAPLAGAGRAKLVMDAAQPI
jgi:hypothetical protein